MDYELDTPAELAKAFHVKRELGLRGGLLVTNPIPEEYSMDKAVIDKAIAEAVEDAKKDGIHGKATTPYLLAKIKDLTGGDSLDSNIQLVFNNARLGAAAAVELAKMCIRDRSCSFRFKRLNRSAKIYDLLYSTSIISVSALRRLSS